MKKITTLFLLLITLSLTAQELNYERGEILIQLKDGATPQQVDRELENIELTAIKTISSRLNLHKVSFDPFVTNETQALRMFKLNNNVHLAQLNHKVSLRSTTPDDPLFSNQWQYFQSNDRDIDADEAWDITTGGTTVNGDEIVVGVVDGGFHINHPDLNENLYINEAEIPNNDIDDDNNGYIDDVNGWNAYNSTGNITPDNHGTAVYGIVGAKGNNGIGVTGVNWDVKVMPISGSSGNESVVLEAYSYILESRILYNETNGEEGAFVVVTNASFGIDFGQPEDSPLWCAMYDTLGENGILSCGATINGNQNVDIVGDVPTACPSEYMIAVTNTNINDVKVNNAGFGLETIDLGAPGAGTFTTSGGNSYGGFGGTSGATPHVAGTIALLYSAPCQDIADLAINNPQAAAIYVRDLVLDKVDANPSLEGITVTGGRLNVYNSMQSLMGRCENVVFLNVDSFETGIAIFPNPANDFISIVSENNAPISSLKVYGINGSTLLQEANPTTSQLDISFLSKGMYILEVTLGDGSANIIKTFIKE